MQITFPALILSACILQAQVPVPTQSWSLAQGPGESRIPASVTKAIASLVEVNAITEDGDIFASGPGIPVAKGWVWLHVPDLGIPPVITPKQKPLAGMAIFGARGNSEWERAADPVPGVIQKGAGPIPKDHALFQEEQRWPWGFIRGEHLKGRGVPVFTKDGTWVGLQWVLRIPVEDGGTGGRPLVWAGSLAVPQGIPLPAGPGRVFEESALDLLENRLWDRLERLVGQWQTVVPGDPAAWFYLGRCHTGRGRQLSAIAAYQRALEGLPEDPMVWTSLAKSQARNLDFEQASKSLERALILRPGLFYQPAEMVRLLHVLGEHDQEFAWENRCPRMAPPPPPGYVHDRNANWLETHGRWDEALTIWQVKLREGEKAALPRIVQCLHKAGRHEDEPTYLRMMIPGDGNPWEEDRTSLECRLDLEHKPGLGAEERLGAWSSHPPPSPAKLVEELVAHHDQAALTFLLNAPGMAHYDWRHHLDALIDSDFLDEALLILNRPLPPRAQQTDDGEPSEEVTAPPIWFSEEWAPLELIRKLKRRGRNAEAMTAFRIANNPENSLAHGFTLLELGMIGQAEGVFQSILKAREEASAHLGLGLIAERMGMSQTALMHYRKASELHRSRESVFDQIDDETSLAEAFLRNDHPAEAETLLCANRAFLHEVFTPTFEGDDVTRTVGDNDKALSLLNQMLDARGNLDRAIQAAREHLGFCYHDAPMWLRLGELYLKKGQQDDAQICLKRLKALQSPMATTLETKLHVRTPTPPS